MEAFVGPFVKPHRNGSQWVVAGGGRRLMWRPGDTDSLDGYRKIALSR
jgi:hypothetical protein